MRLQRDARTGLRRTVGTVGSLVLVTGILAGCAGGARPGTAAVVDGRTIPASEVSDALSQLGPLFNGATPQLVLQVLIDEPTLTQLASDKGVGINDAEATQFLAQSFQGAGVAAPARYSTGAMAIARYQLAANNVQGLSDSASAVADLQKRLAALKVTVNPRYGTFDPTAAGVAAPTASPWIVTQGAQPQPTGSEAPAPSESAVPEPTGASSPAPSASASR